jgi:hypothetical protein
MIKFRKAILSRAASASLRDEKNMRLQVWPFSSREFYIGSKKFKNVYL